MYHILVNVHLIGTVAFIKYIGYNLFYDFIDDNIDHMYNENGFFQSNFLVLGEKVDNTVDKIILA